MSASPAAIADRQRYAQRVASLGAALAERGVRDIELALVLGSGLGAFVERLSSAVTVPYGDLPMMPQSTVPGHAGQFVMGELPDPAGGAPVRVLCQAGRVHLYEGFSAREVTLAMRALPLVGTRAVILTNAAGGIGAGMTPGTLMRICDHLNRQGASPLFADERGAVPLYDERLAEHLERAAAAESVALSSGVYAGLLGPSYETPAEIRFLARAGADAVGMSTVLEALAARAAGLAVGGISCITNLAAGIGSAPLDHQEVIDTGAEAAEGFGRLLARALPSIARS